MECVVFVKETLCRMVKIKAKDEAAAIEKVKKMYDSEEIVLDYNDYVDTNFMVHKMPQWEDEED